MKIKSQEFEKQSNNHEQTFGKENEVQGGQEQYRVPIEQVVSEFHTDSVNGLSAGEAKARLGKYGANNLGKEESISYTKILAHQVFNAMILVLFISMIIALAIRDWISGGVIGFVVGINIVVGFVQ